MLKGAIIILVFASLLAIGIAKATTFDTLMQWNGSSNFTIGIVNENIINVQHFESDGVGWVRLTFDDGSERVVLLEDYIAQNQAQWSQDTNDWGLTLSELILRLKNGIDWAYGIYKTPLDLEKQLIMQLARLFVTRTEYEQQIAILQLRVEALEKTLENGNENSHAYCQGKLETMLKYNLTSVACDLLENGTTQHTTYHNHMTNSNGENIIIGITPLD